LRLLLQRVSRAEVRIAEQSIGSIGPGLVIFVGVGPADDEALATRMARRVAELRVFEDEHGQTNRSLLETARAALVVSQFTLYADTSRGRRPGFAGGAPAALAERVYEGFVAALRALDVTVATGRFGAPMDVELVNRGPFTIRLDSD
jgi:D-tyrosyl-tRNA(Tyr) deacylase